MIISDCTFNVCKSSLLMCFEQYVITFCRVANLIDRKFERFDEMTTGVIAIEYVAVKGDITIFWT